MRRPKTTENIRKIARPLSLEQCLAKTQRTSEGTTVPGQNVLSHCSVVGHVAEELASAFPGIIQKEWLSDGVGFLAAGHDIGKISPTFQNKIHSALTSPDKTVLQTLSGFDASLESNWGHSGVSELSAKAWKLGEYIPEIWGCHHGFRPAVASLSATDEIVGGQAWQERREELKNKLLAEFGSTLPTIKTSLHAKVLAGLTTVSDWIGSGQLCDKPFEDYSRENIACAVRQSGFEPIEIKKNLSFENIFGFKPNATQELVAIQCKRPGIYVLEAPMGLGKTEAALFAAYQLMSSGRATGMYFALPTQTTSEAIYERVNSFLERILPDNAAIRQAMLIHGNAWVRMSSMGADAGPGGSWFSARKRSILAPFGVGTIDQALMAVMNVRHGFVRTFGLLGKVVILDEVHSYDMYTGTILDELVRVLRQLGCTVIVLSATLTQSRRKELIGEEVASSAYPLLTCLGQQTSELREVSVATSEQSSRSVSVSIHQNESEVIAEVIARANAGEQVLWIENTVAEAQDRYLQMLSSINRDLIEIGLIHSRFTKADRSRNETYWVNVLGKHGEEARGLKGRILIGTQVLEQSLDIDSDLLVTRICPSDMLLQRLGRLWRHNRKNRAASARCQVKILCPDLQKAFQEPEKAFGPTAAVYAPYILCRTLEVWHSLSTVSLPDDIRNILEQTYAAREEQGEFARMLDAMVNGDSCRGRKRLGTSALRTLALAGMSELAPAASDESAPTRYSQTESVDVLVLKHFSRQGQTVQLELADGSRLTLPNSNRSLVAASLLNNSVSVPGNRAIRPQDISCLLWLKPYMYISDIDRTRTRVVVMDESGYLSSPFDDSVEHSLSYDSLVGYRKSENSEQ